MKRRKKFLQLQDGIGRLHLQSMEDRAVIALPMGIANRGTRDDGTEESTQELNIMSGNCGILRSPVCDWLIIPERKEACINLQSYYLVSLIVRISVAYILCQSEV